MGKKSTRPSNPIAGYTAKGKGPVEEMPCFAPLCHWH